jgi:GDPmannose 4,6-dehydratase
MKKKALICGISGQDGSLLAKFLLKKDYQIIGTSRDAQVNSFSNLRSLQIYQDIFFTSMVPEDFKSVFVVLNKFKPDEVYYLGGQSSVGLSFEQPTETIQSMLIGTLNILEAIRLIDAPIKFYNAGSSECFGDVGEVAANETTPFHPQSPYAVAKASAFWLINNYRDSYKIHACTGILFNHESPLRHPRFVTKKIIDSAGRISNGSSEKLRLGNLKISRDWGWAPEYVEAMWLMLQTEKPDDFIIATGITSSLEDFVSLAFGHFNLNWEEYVIQDKDLFRPSDIAFSKADPQKATDILGWKAKYYLKDIVEKMIKNEIY